MHVATPLIKGETGEYAAKPRQRIFVEPQSVVISTPAILWAFGYYFIITIFRVAMKSPAVNV